MPSSLAASAAEVIFIDVDEFSAAQQPNPRRAPAPTTGPSRGVSGSDSDDEVVFEGFRRQVMSTHKQADFDTNGFTYMGFADGKSIRRVNSHLQGQNIQPARPKTSEGDSIATAIEILDDEDDPPSHSGGFRTEGPPRKKQKTSATKFVPVPIVDIDSSCKSSRKHKSAQQASAQQTLQAININTVRCHDEDAEDVYTSALELDRAQNWVPSPTKPAGLSLRSEEEDVDMLAEEDDDELAISMASLAFDEEVSSRLLDRTARLQRQGVTSHRPEDPSAIFVQLQLADQYYCSRSRSRRPVLFADPSPRPIHQYTGFRPIFRDLHRLQLVYEAPGDINTVVQRGSMVVIASAVADGALDDVPGAYNDEGSLGVWDGTRKRILKGHSVKADRNPVLLQRHSFTVNDVAIDPTNPIGFASAGRDNQVLLWEYKPPPEPVDQPQGEQARKKQELQPVLRVKCDDNPEVVKYRPGTSTLAIQCNNGDVYILHNNQLSNALQVAPAMLKHITADIHWGAGPTSNHLFASSACAAGKGFHKQFDIEKMACVMKYEADSQACSTLTVDRHGMSLYIATEGPDSPYILRRYDVRVPGDNEERGSPKAVQQVALEPFAGNSDRSLTDINGLTLSSDGIYVAAARTDNWLDVYDTRMLSRGPLYKFAHEGGGGDTFGVVKAQWVEGYPFGTGFVSGGVDGCVRLWDMRLSDDDPYNGRALVRCDYDIATFTLGDIYSDEAPLVVGERSGKVTTFGFGPREDY